MPIYRYVNKQFFKIWTADMAYVLGFFAADGYITVNNRGGQFWCIEIVDKKLLQSIKKSINSEHKISIRLPKKESESIKYRLQIGSIEMCNDLRRLGFSERKTKSLVVPNVPAEYFSSFVRGYFDGDGNIWVGEIHKDKNRITRHKVLKLCFTSCSNVFLRKLKERLEVGGILGGCLYRSKTKEFSRLQYSTINALKLSDFMYNIQVKSFSPLFLGRKKNVFEKFKNLRS
ncbi:MAG: LAGLIDADG family homing endonuclease [Candidatus Paceibacterota bacterium]